MRSALTALLAAALLLAGEREDRYQEELRRGRAAIAGGRMEEARTHFDEAARLLPRSELPLSEERTAPWIAAAAGGYAVSLVGFLYFGLRRRLRE